MVMPVTSDPDLAFAERDLSMLKGGGMESDRPYITWGQLQALRKAGRGQELRKYALIMRAPGAGKAAVPGAGPPVAMPAEKESKWYGQGFRACVSVEDQTLVVIPPPPEPKIWLPSMVEEAMQRGETIPEEMAPAGYVGPTLSIKAMRQKINAETDGDLSFETPEQRVQDAEARAAAAELELGEMKALAEQRQLAELVNAAQREGATREPAQAGAAAEVFPCEAEGCTRFFDSADALKGHARAHKAAE